MEKDALPLPDLMRYFICFYIEVLTKFNGNQQQIVLVAHNGTIFENPFICKKWNTTMSSQTFALFFTLIP